MSTRALHRCAICALFVPFWGLARADVIGDGLVITAQDAFGNSATWTAPLSWDGQRWTYIGSQEIELRDPDTGVLLGYINPADDPQAGTSVEYLQDPVINLNFSVQAGVNPTTFQISSALLTFPTIANPQGAASAAISVTDALGDGATLTGIGVTGGAYLAQYNGFAGADPPAGTTFAELHPSIVAGPFATTTVSDEVPAGGGFTAIGTPVSDMSAPVSSTLASFDLASGTTVYSIVPEPATLMLVVGLAVVVRRRIGGR